MRQLNMLKLKQSYLTSKLSLNSQAIITEQSVNLGLYEALAP